VKSPTHVNSAARIITIGGGKGGVGKSIISSNLAVAMAQNGHRVVLVDCDLGAANQHVLFGIDRPLPGLQALIDSLTSAMTPTPLPNLHLVAGTGASVGAANISHGEKQRIMKKIRALEADVVVVDVGAGVSFNVLDFFELGSQRLLVVTPQVTSIQTAYSFLKGAVLRTLRHSAEKTAEIELLEPAIASRENEKVSQMLLRLREQHPDFGEAIFQILARFNAQIVGNQVFEENQTGIFHAVARMISDFLGINVPILGYVGVSRRIRESVNQRRPMLLGGQKDENAKIFREMADNLLMEDVSIDDLLIDEEEETEQASVAGEISSPPSLSSEAPAAATTPAATGAAETASTAEGSAEGKLQPEYTPYARKHLRHVVDWKATVRSTVGDTTVRVLEISAGGLALESSARFEIGDRLTVIFEHLPDRPTVIVTVTRRISRGYAVEGEMPPALAFAASHGGESAGSRLAG
jgi:flagellar biosynthesis protein FlhG